MVRTRMAPPGSPPATMPTGVWVVVVIKARRGLGQAAQRVWASRAGEAEDRREAGGSRFNLGAACRERETTSPVWPRSAAKR